MKISKHFWQIIPMRFQSRLKQMLNRGYLAYTVLRRGVSPALFSDSANLAYSQEGEDRILYSLFGVLNKKKGFYVDIGAHHPTRFSNTYNLYLQGWRGINVDANSDAIKQFVEMRPRDTNLAVGVGERASQCTFFIFDEPALNTFDENVAENVVSNTPYKIIKKQTVEIMPLSEILNKHMDGVSEIDLLSVDVEGKDLDVLKSNDWSKYRPAYIAVECHSGFTQKEGFSLEETINDEVAQYLKLKGYEPFAKTLNTVFFKFKKYPVETNLKVFCYDLPAECQSRQGELPLASETFYALYDFFKNNTRTTDPKTADYFFVPLNLIQFQFRNEDPKEYIRQLRYLTNKKNHILVATGDFSQRSKKNHFGHAYQENYDWLDDFILLALESTNDLIPGQDIGIIPLNTLVDNPYFNTNERSYLYSFLGSLDHELLPENHVRKQLNLLEKRSDVLIASKLDHATRETLGKAYNYAVKDDYELVARNSLFTLAPAGYGKWTYRFFQSIQWGSIPVLFSDDYIKPFSNEIPYDSFSITLPEKSILDVDKVLRNFSSKEIQQFQENLKLNQSKFTKMAFFEMLMRSLEGMRAKKHVKNGDQYRVL